MDWKGRKHEIYHKTLYIIEDEVLSFGSGVLISKADYNTPL